MLLNILYFGVFAYEETVNSVVLAVACAAIVDTAACDDDDITILSNMEIVVYSLFKPRFA